MCRNIEQAAVIGLAMHVEQHRAQDPSAARRRPGRRSRTRGCARRSPACAAGRSRSPRACPAFAQQCIGGDDPRPCLEETAVADPLRLHRAGRTAARPPPRPPAARPSASRRMDLPAPVSPVSTLRPGANSSAALFDQHDIADRQGGQHPAELTPFKESSRKALLIQEPLSSLGFILWDCSRS